MRPVPRLNQFPIDPPGATQHTGRSQPPAPISRQMYTPPPRAAAPRQRPRPLRATQPVTRAGRRPWLRPGIEETNTDRSSDSLFRDATEVPTIIFDPNRQHPRFGRRGISGRTGDDHRASPRPGGGGDGTSAAPPPPSTRRPKPPRRASRSARGDSQRGRTRRPSSPSCRSASSCAPAVGSRPFPNRAPRRRRRS
jgi:hypothetical protein